MSSPRSAGYSSLLTCYLLSQHPESHVIGVDLSPIQPSWYALPPGPNFSHLPPPGSRPTAPSKSMTSAYHGRGRSHSISSTPPTSHKASTTGRRTQSACMSMLPPSPHSPGVLGRSSENERATRILSRSNAKLYGDSHCPADSRAVVVPFY